MQRDRQNYALQTIFSFFLGLMVLAFIGIGVNTFYESPGQKYDKQLQELYRKQGDISQKAVGDMTPAEKSRYDQLQTQIDDLQAKQQAEMDVWARNTSIVLILFATLVMGVSLVRSEQLRVISNGLLLGGLLTMVYGAGWAIFAGQSIARFGVIVFALAITIGLGYVKFVRQREEAAEFQSVPAAAYVGAGDVGDLAARVSALEKRAAAAAAALGADSSADEHPQG